MKIIHVVRQYLPSVGGMEEVVRNLVGGQLASGQHLPVVVTLDRLFRDRATLLPAEEVIEGVTVRRIPFHGSERYPIAPGVLAAIADADIVHVHGIDFFYDFLALTRPFHRKPLIASTHGGFFHTPFAQRLKKTFFQTVTRLSSRAYSRVICTSANDGDMFSAIVPADRLSVVENGVDIHKFAGTASRQLRPTLIYFGRWSVNKGIIEALEIFSLLCRANPDIGWHFHIAGREYDLTQADLQNHIYRLGLEAAVTTTPNPSNTALIELIGNASYFICLSRHEGFGIAPIEAMSAGLTPILSDIPPFQRLHDLTSKGLICKGNHSDVAVSIMNLHDHLTQDEFSAYQRRLIKTKQSVDTYSWNAAVNSYDECTKAACRTHVNLMPTGSKTSHQDAP